LRFGIVASVVSSSGNLREIVHWRRILKGVTPEVIAEVRRRASMVDVIAEEVMLKKAGKDYKGLCPFHCEKSPSFFVSTEKGIFKCFGCGECGDIFTFLQKRKGLDFIDAVSELALRYGVPLEQRFEQEPAYDGRSLKSNRGDATWKA
jgi:DNA primase